MKLNSFAAVAKALEEAGVRYLVAGGLAVNAHGYLRYTKDVDLVVQLMPENILNAFAALASIGYLKPLHGSIDVRFVSITTTDRHEDGGRPATGPD